VHWDIGYADVGGTEVDLNRDQWQVTEHNTVHLSYASGELPGLHE